MNPSSSTGSADAWRPVTAAAVGCYVHVVRSVDDDGVPFAGRAERCSWAADRTRHACIIGHAYNSAASVDETPRLGARSWR